MFVFSPYRLSVMLLNLKRHMGEVHARELTVCFSTHVLGCRTNIVGFTSAVVFCAVGQVLKLTFLISQSSISVSTDSHSCSLVQDWVISQYNASYVLLNC